MKDIEDLQTCIHVRVTRLERPTELGMYHVIKFFKTADPQSLSALSELESLVDSSIYIESLTDVYEH